LPHPASIVPEMQRNKPLKASVRRSNSKRISGFFLISHIREKQE
jgi:hypothetical protein